LETGRAGWGCDRAEKLPTLSQVRSDLRRPHPERIFAVHHAMKLGLSVEEIYELTAIDPWFLDKLASLITVEKFIRQTPLPDINKAQMLAIKQEGFSDRQIAFATKAGEDTVRTYRKSLGVIPVYKMVDTCAAEFESTTPYYYSTYEEESEVLPSERRKIMILGGGPNRIGQGIEFDYCCCHASFALQADDYETIMVNSNPETVSTDYDTSDRLYFEPLTKEDVLNIIEAENPDGIIIQFGGQTPLKLAVPLQEYLDEVNDDPATLRLRSGFGDSTLGDSNLRGLSEAAPPTQPIKTKIWGTSPDSIDAAEDRERFEQMLRELDIRQPPNGLARSNAEALKIAQDIDYPVVVRPSYVLGGRAMEIVYSDEDLVRYMTTAVQVEPDHPILIDKFLENAIEVDVDAIADHTGTAVIGGIMEHIEQAGIHSGDSACTLPTVSLSDATLATIRNWTFKLAKRLNVIGLMNIQYAIQGEQVYIIEANPRASRTVPFVSKATGARLAQIAVRVMSGKTLADLGLTEEIIPPYLSVKEAVLPFNKFTGTDTLLGPEMRSTGEVMGIADSFGQAYAKAELAAGQILPQSGTVFISVNDRDKPAVVPIAQAFVEAGFGIVATSGTYRTINEAGIAVESILKIHEGRPHVGDAIKNQNIQLIVNSPVGEAAQEDDRILRRTALDYKIPTVTTLAGAKATLAAIRSLKSNQLTVKALQDHLA
ncbi:carbamoyl-phosphate synthase large subunit, partial [cf. Phormidesmis sp. LEGE 11477]|uniref:carbamoyl-phosphate synthase large subunit n=1 Tax=cf. Phormidesmis sp. LEGE 11477 TaxID=1828680 RepID=UPI00187E5B76